MEYILYVLYTFFLPPVAALLYFLVSLTIRNYKLTSYWKKRGVPHFPPVPLFSKKIVDSFLIKTSTLNEIYYHGSGNVCCGFYQFRKPALLIRSAHVVNLIFNQEFKIFQDKRRSEYSEANRDPLSQHLLILNGEKWRQLRAKLSPTFTNEKVKSMYPLLEVCSNNFVKVIERTCHFPIDVKSLCEKTAMDSIASCAFGVEFNCINGQSNRFLELGKTPFKPGRWLMFKAHFRTLYPKIYNALKIRAYGEDVNSFFFSFLKQAIALRRQNNEKRLDLLSMLMKIMEDNETDTASDSTSGIKFTEDVIASQAFSFYIGGYETTSTAMSCLFYEIARNKEVRHKLQSEIDEKFTSSDISFEDLNSLVYLDMVIKEGLRLYPPAFYVQRISSEDFVIPGTDICIEKGMELVIPITEIQRDENYFPDPLKFIPERFSPENRDSIVKGSYIPFGDGPRVCIGMRFSFTELKLILAKTLKEFDFELDPCVSQNLESEEYSRVYKVKNPIFVNFSKRRSS